mmetsp:Transcript_3485/g.9233  ORF Transcript_3485/g.9233 Transcript_3485/m.9233 type:complete len:83 (+) Transcript_3485:1174-1422(+)
MIELAQGEVVDGPVRGRVLRMPDVLHAGPLNGAEVRRLRFDGADVELFALVAPAVRRRENEVGSDQRAAAVVELDEVGELTG